ncbi:hypothetical protein HA402_002615 [Bradysia odoriphaga]|nr:hypothetical protein HA402_002615 [Bradysia odoriphaga]
MALSVLQLGRKKCIPSAPRTILSILNQPASAFGLVTNKSTHWSHTRNLSCLTTQNAFSKTNVHHGLIPIGYRQYSTNDDQRPSAQLPTLMDFPKIVWPSLLKTIKNWILVNFIIRPYFDQEFNMPDFVIGTKQAVQVVSTALASGELQSLDGLVSTEAQDELKKNLSVMSVSQRNEVAVNKDDIYFTFPYQVGVIFDESNESVQKRFVEITMVFHVLRGLKEMQDSGNPPPLNVGMLPEYRDKISICNYRFIKQFTQGFESDWTVNVASHYKPIDMVNE